MLVAKFFPEVQVSSKLNPGLLYVQRPTRKLDSAAKLATEGLAPEVPFA